MNSVISITEAVLAALGALCLICGALVLVWSIRLYARRTR